MKKHRFQTIGTNAIDPAAPAAAWGKGVPATLLDDQISRPASAGRGEEKGE